MNESFRCPLCGGDAATPVMTLHDRVARTTSAPFPLVRCAGCGLLRLHPPPDASTLAAAYGPDYAPHSRPGLSGRAKGWLERRSVHWLWSVLRPPRRVLDVGCASGELLLVIREHGNSDVTGVEPGAEAAALARSRGLDVRTGFLEDAGFPDGAFDTIIASHTLEHVADPLAFLREAHRLLGPRFVDADRRATRRRGVLLLWLPNAASIEARLFGRYWIGYDAPRHLTTFSVATLCQALEATGFDVWSVKHEAIGLEWAWALRLWLRERAPASEPVLRRLHPLLILLSTPPAALSAQLGRSGRIRVVAVAHRTRDHRSSRSSTGAKASMCSTEPG